MKSTTVELTCGVYETLNLDDLVKECCSLLEFLYFLAISDIEEYVLKTYYKRNPQYNVGAMIRLGIAYYFYKGKGYVRIVKSLTDRDLALLKIKKIPSKSEVHHFVHYRVGEKRFQEIMNMIAPKLYRRAKDTGYNRLSQDSTPLEASRYDKYAEFNVHYNCKMDKGHITMQGPIPLWCTHTGGVANDSPYFKPHAYALAEHGVTSDIANMDGQYDSYENHAISVHVLGAHPYITLREDATVNDEGTVEQIDHWCNKLWKEGGSPKKPLEEKLKFLFEQGRIEQVGAYYRNKNLTEGMPKEKTDLRKEQERIHNHIKDTVKFDVRNRMNSKKSLHIIAAFVSYQLLVLTALQNDLNPNEFGFIIK